MLGTAALTVISLPPSPRCAVYAVDSVGNQGQPATAQFVVDTTPPTFTTLE